jgi:hypothetical protein
VSVSAKAALSLNVRLRTAVLVNSTTAETAGLAMSSAGIATTSRATAANSALSGAIGGTAGTANGAVSGVTGGVDRAVFGLKAQLVIEQSRTAAAGSIGAALAQAHRLGLSWTTLLFTA